MTEDIRRLTEEYISQVESLILARKFGEGIFGTHDNAKDSPCHLSFYEQVGEKVRAIDKTDTYEIASAAEFILKAHSMYKCSDLASWMLISVQQHAKELIPFLSEEKKQSLAFWYEKKYPKIQRLPVQKEICRLLKK